MVVFDNGSEINVSVTKDISPEIGREGWGTSLGIEAANCILDVQVVDCSEHVSFFSIGDVSPM